MMKSRTSTPTQSRVLAIDPGFDRVGIAILEGDHSTQTLIYSECLTTDKKAPREQRLKEIGERIKNIIDKWQPETLAVETLFFNKNTSSALGVAEARGVILFQCVSSELSVYEYSPQAIKIAVTGYGKADKTQIETMVRKLVKVPKSQEKRLDDELDAIAVGITHLATNG